MAWLRRLDHWLEAAHPLRSGRDRLRRRQRSLGHARPRVRVELGRERSTGRAPRPDDGRAGGRRRRHDGAVVVGRRRRPPPPRLTGRTADRVDAAGSGGVDAGASQGAPSARRASRRPRRRRRERLDRGERPGQTRGRRPTAIGLHVAGRRREECLVRHVSDRGRRVGRSTSSTSTELEQQLPGDAGEAAGRQRRRDAAGRRRTTNDVACRCPRRARPAVLAKMASVRAALVCVVERHARSRRRTSSSGRRARPALVAGPGHASTTAVRRLALGQVGGRPTMTVGRRAPRVASPSGEARR